ncbi:DUF885 domain-containing protein [Agarilytica rhodophyticola]|uniref:DUF885 domain-containing protein n=1 Tax=Agarilytica rhodophyticola TaxID=1737490 RepID=UPI000B349E3A|nr:DUF885 domain-containing protein [Agarilytica rhodophyticola]
MKLNGVIKSWALVAVTASIIGCGKANVREDVAVQDTSPSQQLQQVIDDHWADNLARNPVFATTLGVRDYDQSLGRQSVAAMDDEVAAAKEFLARLEKIDIASLSADERLNAELLTLSLKNVIEAANFNGRLMLITNRGGWHTFFARLPEQLSFFSKSDYSSYIDRLNDFPRYNDEGIATLSAAIETGYTQSCEAMEGYEESIAAHIVAKTADSIFMKPFTKMPASIGEDEQSALKAAAEEAIENKVIPAYKRFYDFYLTQYNPKCRKASGLYGLAGADDYYAHRARMFTTTDMTPEQIHQLGLAEVKRIISEMEEVIKSVDFKGDRAEFVEFLRKDPQFYPKTGEELLRYAAYISKKADGALPKMFSVIPRMPYSVQAIPADIAEKTTTAYYEPPAGDGTRAGVYRVNLSKLDTRPLFEMEALSLHEAVPGHHFQIALAQELGELPAFRRFGGMTAFIEGWGLYSERLGLEMGFYKDPYSNFGRLSYEMWRACRLVVDTGLHAKGWSRQQAIDFMAENTALSLHNIESEVDRYITWPGQALAYKIGELKIRELRAMAEESLGDKFNVRYFHDAVLRNGAVPLTVLENLITDWVAEEKKRVN